MIARAEAELDALVARLAARCSSEETARPRRLGGMTTQMNSKLWLWLVIAAAILAAVLLGPSMDGSTATTDSYFHRPVLDP